MTDLNNFKLYKYPFLTLLIMYAWIESTNPFLSHALQIIPRINNAHIAIFFAWLLLPKQLKIINLPKSKILYALPFLMVISIKIPFVEFDQMNTIIAVAADWIFFLIYFPLYIKLFSTKSGKETFFICGSISSIIACVIYVFYLSGLKLFPFISSNILSVGFCIYLPIALRGIIFKTGFVQYINTLSLILILFSVIFGGGRSILIVSLIQILLFSLYFLSFQKIIKKGAVILFLLFFVSLFFSVEQSQIDYRNEKYSRIVNWQEDGSIYLRVALYAKATDIFLNNFLLGAGWGSKTLARIEGVEVDFNDFRTVKTRTKGLHSTFLRIISGTGLLGILAFLFFIFKNVRCFFQIKFQFIKYNVDFFVFLSISVGLFLNATQNTTGLNTFLIISSFILSTQIYTEYIMRLYRTHTSRSRVKK